MVSGCVRAKSKLIFRRFGIMDLINTAPDEIQDAEDVEMLCEVAWTRSNKGMLDRAIYENEMPKA